MSPVDPSSYDSPDQAPTSSREKGFLFNQTVELELLVSVAVVFASFQLSQWVKANEVWAINHNIGAQSVEMVIVALAGEVFAIVMPICIGMHLLLRIYWLALTSFRTTFGDNQPKDLGYKPPFQHLVRRTSNIDQQIRRTDQVSSSISAYSFLLFLSFSFGLIGIFGTIMLLAHVFQEVDQPMLVGLGRFLRIFILVGGAINLIDLLTIGIFKQSRFAWVQKAFWPIHRIFGWITLSFLYRGIYYQLAQYTSRIILGILLLVSYLATLFISDVIYRGNTLDPLAAFPPFTTAQTTIANPNHYLSNFEELTTLTDPFIPAFVVPRQTHHLKVSIPVNLEIEGVLRDSCSLEKAFTMRGTRFMNVDRLGLFEDLAYPSAKELNGLLGCFDDNLSVWIDSQEVVQPPFFVDYYPPADRMLFSTMLPLDSLRAGQHYVSLIGPGITNGHVDIAFFKD